MVGHQVEQQPHAARCELAVAQRSKSCLAAQLRVELVVVHHVVAVGAAARGREDGRDVQIGDIPINTAVLERGELRVELEAGRFFVRHFDQRFPLGPKSLLELVETGGEQHWAVARTTRISRSSRACERRSSHLPDRRASSEADAPGAPPREGGLQAPAAGDCSASRRRSRSAFDAALEQLNGTPGDSPSFDALDRLLGEQSYRLASWRVASQEINYRRFFDIN